MTAPLLEVQHLTKRFGGLTAVSDVTFDVQPGEILGILGPNGAGKTTLFNLLTGFIRPEDAQDLAWLHVERHVAHGGQAAEALGQVLDFEQRRGHGDTLRPRVLPSRFHSGATKPFFMKKITRMRITA
jgi:ATPase subunit of ABC transporter with duplicated ATPase domains